MALHLEEIRPCGSAGSTSARYFHVVFTVPAPVAEMAFQNKAVLYGILFTAAAETLRIIAADPKHLGAEIGWAHVPGGCLRTLSC
jgi:hypothetical protein